MGEVILPAASEWAVGFSDSQEPSLWTRWKITGGHYLPPDPIRFDEMRSQNPTPDRQATIRTVLDHGLERSGLILSPQQLSAPLEQLTLGANPDYDDPVLANFLEYCETMDQLDRYITSAIEYLGGLGFDQRTKNLINGTSGCNYARVPAMKVIDQMYKSNNESFRPVADAVRKDAQAIIRVLYAWQENIDLSEIMKPKAD
jgi:hypothetical protein